MGSESSPIVLFEAIAEAVKQNSEAVFVILLTQAVLDLIQPQPHPSIEFHPVTEVITMDDDPLSSIRQKKNSSLVKGLELLKRQEINGFITAGNTGALIAAATLTLPLLGTIKRPALLANLPTKKGKISIIDVGGTVSERADYLIQFAHIGIAFQQSVMGVKTPKVGLLNIGVESKKGSSEVRKAYEYFQSQPGINFVGNIEGREVFQGVADVLVTDGFTGNVLLKTAEGVYAFILEQLQQTLNTMGIENKEQIFQSMRSQFDYEEYMGAIVCGVDGLVVKCHGNTSARGLSNAINGTVHLVRNQFIQQIKNNL